jgi:hypothetical protein
MSDMVVNDSLTIAVDAEPAAVLEALRVVDMVGSLTRVLRALGAGSRLALPPTILSRAGSADPDAYARLLDARGRPSTHCLAVSPSAPRAASGRGRRTKAGSSPPSVARPVQCRG